jgi:hypothetical protein
VDKVAKKVENRVENPCPGLWKPRNALQTTGLRECGQLEACAERRPATRSNVPE